MKIVYILLWSRETDHKCSMKRGILLCFGGEVQNLKKDLRITLRTLTDFLSILSMVMFPYIRPQPVF